MTILEAFELIADKLELQGVDVSVCDECCRTYPSEWVIDNICPFCLQHHTYEDWITLETYPIWHNRNKDEPKDFQDTHIMTFSITPEELKDALDETDWYYDWFLENWTWDMAKEIYNIIVVDHTPYGGIAITRRKNIETSC